MVKTIKDVFPNLPKDDGDLVIVSDELWKLGNVDEIKEKVSPELFIVHVGMNVIGNFQSDGWHSIFMYQRQLLPYISKTLNELGLHEVEASFQKVLSQFPELFCNADEAESLNFLNGAYWKYSEKELKQYSKEERTKITDYNRVIKELDDVSDTFLSQTPNDGWESVLDYISKRHDV